MKKYTGTYRVLGELAELNDKIYIADDTYISCYSSFQIYRYDRIKLIIQCPNLTSYNARVKLLTSKDIWFENSGYDDGGDITFKEKDFDKLLKFKIGKGNFIKPIKKGKSIKYNDKVNLPKS